MVTNWPVEREGINAVLKALNSDLRWIAREQQSLDFGIDVHAEAADQRNVPLGRLIAVQVKSGSSYFNYPAPGGWWFYVDATHERYWLDHSLPVIVVLYNPASKELYWEKVTRETLQPGGEGKKLLILSKNRLDSGAVRPLSELAEARAPVARPQSAARHRFVLIHALEGAARDDARIAFELGVDGSDNIYHPGDPMGQYILVARREFGLFHSMVLIAEHLGSLNRLLHSRRLPQVELHQFLAGLGMALPIDATPQEFSEIRIYASENAEAYWGGKLVSSIVE